MSGNCCTLCCYSLPYTSVSILVWIVGCEICRVGGLDHRRQYRTAVERRRAGQGPTPGLDPPVRLLGLSVRPLC